MVKTREEIEAACMLLGCNYDPKMHTLFRENPNKGPADSMYYQEFDVDTLEEMTQEQLEQRAEETGGSTAEDFYSGTE